MYNMVLYFIGDQCLNKSSAIETVCKLLGPFTIPIYDELN